MTAGLFFFFKHFSTLLSHNNKEKDLARRIIKGHKNQGKYHHNYFLISETDEPGICRFTVRNADIW